MIFKNGGKNLCEIVWHIDNGCELYVLKETRYGHYRHPYTTKWNCKETINSDASDEAMK